MCLWLNFGKSSFEQNSANNNEYFETSTLKNNKYRTVYFTELIMKGKNKGFIGYQSDTMLIYCNKL